MHFTLITHIDEIDWRFICNFGNYNLLVSTIWRTDIKKITYRNSPSPVSRSQAE